MCNELLENEVYINYQTGEKLDLHRIAQLKDNAMLKAKPELWCEWDFEKNDELGYNIWDMTKGSEKEVYWYCTNCLSSYLTMIYLKNFKKNCTYCHGRTVNTTNSLASIFPELIGQWHPTLNGDLTPHEVTKASRTKVWWLCDKGHEWQTSVGDRTRKVIKGCPYCANQKINNTNSLASLNPELAKQWHPTLNGELTPHDVGSGGKKKYWWICEKGHEWCAEIYSRSKDKKGCPYCNRLLLCEENTLMAEFPEIAKEWHPSLNGKLTPYNISGKNGKKVWWLGECGHEWEAKVSNRTSANTKCPFCMNSKVLKGFNDIHTTNCELGKYLINYEDGYKFTVGTNMRLDWKCKDCQGIIRSKTPAGMLNNFIRCSGCSDGFSYPEKIVYSLLRKITDNFIYELSFSWSDGKRYDFYIPHENLIIEIHGMQHYEQIGRRGARSLEEEQTNDEYKYELAIANGIQNYAVIDARYSNFEFIKSSISDSILAKIFNLSSINWNDVQIKSQKSALFEVVELWNKGLATSEIANIVNRSQKTVSKYLKRAVKMGICDYNTKETNSRSWNYRRLLKEKSILVYAK